MSESVSNYVYDLRIKKGVTQEELAKIVGVTRQTIIAIEKGNYVPSVLLALKFSHYFKKPVQDIFYIINSK